MGDTLKKVALVVGVGALVVATGGLLGAGFAVTVAGFAGGLTIKTLATIGLLGVSIGLSGGLKPNLNHARQMAANLSTFSSPSAVRTVIFGRALVAGQIIYRENIDNSDEDDTPDELFMVLALAGYPVDSLEKVWLNDTLVFDGSSTTGPGAITTGKFANNLWVWFRTGADDSAAFPEIAALSTTWNAKTRKGRGVPAIALRIKVTKDLEGRVEPLVQVKGAKLYDPRLDTTAGGSGAHRVDDQSTWEWSENPVLAALFYLLGGEVNDKKQVGMSIAPARIDMGTFSVEASVCEEEVDVKGGGTIDRYTCNGILVPEAAHRDNMRQILSACAGSIDASDGTYQIFAGAWRAPSMDLSEADIDQSPTEIQLEKDPSSEINIVRGSFTALAARQILEYPERRDPTSIAKFGERSILLDFPFTNDHRIIQRLTKIEMLRANAQRFFSANYWLGAIPLQPGDIVRQTYVRYGFDLTTMRVNAWGLEPSTDSAGNPKLVVAMQLVEEREEWFDWDEATEEADLSSGEPGLLPAGISSPRLDSLLGSVDFSTRVGGAEKPENNADVTANHKSLDSDALGGVPAATIIADIEAAAVDTDLTELVADIDALEAKFPIKTADMDALSVTADKIAANAVTTAKLDALSVTAGKLASVIAYIGKLEIASSGAVWSGKENFGTAASGWFLGRDGGVPKFRIGNADNTESLTWDGSALVIEGVLIANSTIVSLSSTQVTSVVFSGSATARYRVKGDRSIEKTSGTDTADFFEQWLQGGSAADFQVLMTVTVGSDGVFSGATRDTWHDIPAFGSVEWTLTSSGAEIARTARVDLRRKSDSVVVASAVLDWSAEVTA